MKKLIPILLTGLVAAAAGQKPEDALFAAVRAGDTAAVRAAIASGADSNAKDKDGTPVLVYAALVADTATMRALLEKGADPNAANPAGATPLICAAGDGAKAALLVAHGANVNAQSAAGASPLVVASGSDGNAATVRLLLSKGARVDVHDRVHGIPGLLSGGGQTPALVAAARLRNPETLKVLLAAGADVNAPDGNGATALSDAVLFDNVENVHLLLAAGAKVNFPIAVWKHTPLMAAAMHGNAYVVRMLLDAGAEIDARDASGSTALMWAAYSEHGDAGAASVLIAAGADVNHANQRGETAMDWAHQRGETAVTAALRMVGAREGAVHSDAKAPVHGAEMDTIRAAVDKALPPLQGLGAPTFKQTGCISCHNNLMPSMAASVARTHGFRYSEPDLATNRKIIDAFVTPFTEPMREGLDAIPDLPITGGYVLEALHKMEVAPNAMTDAMVHRIAQSQLADGSWAVWAPRPPIEYSNVTATAMSLRALALYGTPGRRAEFEQRIARARKWLKMAPARTSEERNMRLLGLVWSQAKLETVRAAAEVVIAHQRADGGWAQLNSLAPDAYATGQALVALHEAGADAASPAYRRGVEWLRQAQEADGSWHVKSRTFPFQPLVDTGYAHSRDQWISAQASSWAVMALIYAKDEPTRVTNAAVR